VRSYEHSCGGWYAAVEDADGFHRQPAHCVVTGWGTCYDTPEIALAVARGDREGDAPDGGEAVRS
jgi:hypothetical protein